ncbi:hypothetical protein [Rhodopseudomonas pseudopalustris]|uniref:Uncharacterized protein n=2 Tax=Rhodopseudomonas TaxID=1073 RepID=Q13BR5_RHOPS|nr:hypothetical protein [Rhodopseudomonas pseudopalustris]ABE38474.1 conserved hypothetical protein [Rhodopseudomonas palustris BisB5]SEO32424.1 hypothetical protein SAMN05444123_102246 [Rhodopseudomonas pseudopalustris]
MGMTDRREADRSQAEDGSRQAAPEVPLQELQQENDSLKELVVSLSELVIKRVADQR